MDTDNKLLLSFAIIGNILNLAYNIPFVYLVIKNNSAENISSNFLNLRILGSISWLIYGILKPDIWVLISYLVTLISSSIIFCIKLKEKKTKQDIISTI